MNETKIEIAKNDEPKKNIIITEQFRSTKRWNDLIESFCMNIPLKRHWRYFRTYSDCFTASESIEWLYRHLKTNQNFSHLSISRQNAIKVLQIFLKDKIIEDVRSVNENINFKEFQDDDRVYKFNLTNQYYLNRTTSSTTATSITATMEISTTGSNTINNLTNQTQKNLTYEATSEISSTSENKENIGESQNQNQILKQQQIIKKQNINMTSSVSKQTSTTTNSSERNVSNILKKYEKSNELSARNEKTPNNVGLVTYKADLTIPNKQTNKQDYNYQPGSLKDTQQSNKTNVPLATSSSLIPNYTANNFQILEIWSKTSRKMLESIIKKAVLNNNIFKSHSKQEFSLINKINDRISPPTSSTLKRSTDIKLSLSKLLDKKACESLSSISGAHIRHNCTHVNKHGVVINTENDLPSWLVKAMTTLLLWDSEMEEQNRPKFKEVFDEVTNYFTDLREPLLTEDLSHIFIEILNLLIKPISTNTTNSSTFGSTQKELKKQASSRNLIFEEYGEIVKLFVSSVVCMDEYAQISSVTIEKLVDLLQKQMIQNQLELEELNLETKCISYQLLDAILCISSDKSTRNYDLFEQVESNLIKNAKLPFDADDAEALKNDETDNEEDEYLLQNLLLASLARLESCCHECLVTFNDINNLLNIKPNDYEDYVVNQLNNVESLSQKFETTSFMMMDTTMQSLKKPRNDKANDIENPYGNINSNNFFSMAFCNQDEKMQHQYEKKLHRNNSFRAAIIGELNQPAVCNKQKNMKSIILESTANEANHDSYENDDLFKMPTPKRLTRSVTNSVNSDYKTKLFDEDTNNTTSTISSSSSSSYNHILSSSISSAGLRTNNKKDDFKFKLPFNPGPPLTNSTSTSQPFKLSSNQSINMTKSFSMNFNQTDCNNSSEVDKKNNEESCRKRKVGASNSLVHSSSFNFGFNDENSSFQHFPELKNHKTNKLSSYINESIANKVSASYSLTTLNKISKHETFSSLKNLANLENVEYDNSDENVNNQLKLFSTLSLNELSSFIRTNIRASYNLSEIGGDMYWQTVSRNGQETTQTLNEDKKLKITLSTEIDSEIFYFIISAFRLCALMLPPTNKRKLHLLLRFLNKLKHNKHTAKYLLNQNDSVHLFDEINFIDTSSITNQSLNINDGSMMQKMMKINLNNDLENKSNAIESVIIKSFVNAIVCFDKTKEPQESLDLKEQLIIKLCQILINNYTEIMRIPEDLIMNVKQKIQVLKINAEQPIASSTVNSSNNSESNFSKLSLSNRYCSKISLQQYDKQKAEISKKHLTTLLNNILSDVSMKESEKLLRIRKFKESYPEIYEEKYSTIKKALSILGIKETIETNANIATSSKEDFETIKKKVFLSNFAENLNQTTTNMFSNRKHFQKLFNKKKKL